MSRIAFLLAIASLASACAYHRLVVPEPNPVDQYYHNVSSSAVGWGAIEEQRVADKCSANSLSEVRVKTSFLDSLVTVLTLGFLQPAHYQYRCSKGETGVGEIKP